MDTDPQILKAALKASQIWWQDMGVDIPDLPPQPKRPAKQQAQNRKPSKVKINPQSQNPQSGLKDKIELATALAQSAPTLDALKTALDTFDAGSLSDHAKNMVFARGNPSAKIMAIGEAPGLQEDETSLPFIGPAGQLLDKMFASIGLGEDSLYITNVCNWLPPAGRNPSDDELDMCTPFITRHMELIAPKIIVIVGGVSLQALTGKTGIMKARGQWQELNIGGTKTPAMPLYHPAFLLRRPELKKYAWRDLLAIKARLEG
ncbi:MAG: uracil-DNA glycosylase [Robiginitomaculum sp.]|nr:uracil-DNA glycosylase [Robiginitomaculum sp.]